MDGTPKGRRLVALPETECWRLLATRPWGHLAVVVAGHPDLFAVDHRVDGRTLLIRTEEGAKLRATSGARIAFLVEEIDEVAREGWTVLVAGYGEEVFDPHRLEVDDLDEPLWTGDRVHWVRIVPIKVTGRRLVPHVT
jgi:hypothetical protein